jgi:thiol-disulfide isomerase/thioredoxin
MNTLHAAGLVAGFAALALAGCTPDSGRSSDATHGDATTAAVVDTAAISFTPVDGPGVVAAVRAGGAKVTLVNVWASWCQPCREEFPDLVRLSRELESRGFRLVFVSADFPEDLPAAKSFLAEQGVGGPTFLKTGDDMQFIDTLDPSWSGALPGSVLYDSQGRRIRSWEGKASYDSLRARVLPVLESASGT